MKILNQIRAASKKAEALWKCLIVLTDVSYLKLENFFVLYLFVGNGAAAAAHNGHGTKGNGMVVSAALLWNVYVYDWFFYLYLYT